MSDSTFSDSSVPSSPALASSSHRVNPETLRDAGEDEEYVRDYIGSLNVSTNNESASRKRQRTVSFEAPLLGSSELFLPEDSAMASTTRLAAAGKPFSYIDDSDTIDGLRASRALRRREVLLHEVFGRHGSEGVRNMKRILSSAVVKRQAPLRRVLQSYEGPVVSFAYNLDTKTNSTRMTNLTPLDCIYPRPSDNTTLPAWHKTCPDADFVCFALELDEAKHADRKGKGKARDELCFGDTVVPYSTKDIRMEDEPREDAGYAKRLPFELVGLIMNYLPRDAKQSLRLVDRAMERAVSGNLFQSIVVPFRSNIYTSMIANGPQSNVSPFQKDLNMFQAFGSHVRQFGMTFEVDMDILANPPTKIIRQDHATYWGEYDWPYPDYRRFHDRAELEKTADETTLMAIAFSHLRNVKHLALSLDAGLGWLTGPDKSLRAQILDQTTKIFPDQKSHPSTRAEGGRKIFQALKEAFVNAGDERSLKKSYLARFETEEGELRDILSGRQLSAVTIPTDVLSGAILKNDEERDMEDLVSQYENAEEELGDELDTLDALATRQLQRSMTSTQPTPPAQPVSAGTFFPRPNPYHRPAMHLRPGQTTTTVIAETPPPPRLAPSPPPHKGVLYTCPLSPNPRILQSSLRPAALTKTQQEWLLETAWAQDAFLSSYLIAVADNRIVFSNVQTLSLSRFSSRYLSRICRDDFWDSLPTLASLTIRVISDWRDVQKDRGGAKAVSKEPSKALDPFYSLLEHYVATKKSLQSVTFGWEDGGEHAEGQHARNKHVLPAPITRQRMGSIRARDFTDLLTFPHLKHLRLVNCWLTPNALEMFTALHMRRHLQRITLESVSLTAHPNTNRGHWHNVPAQGNQVLPGQQPQPPPWNGNMVHPAGITPHQVNAHLLQMAQQLTQPTSADAMAERYRKGCWNMTLSFIAMAHKKFKGPVVELELLSCGYIRLPNADFDQSHFQDALVGENDDDNDRLDILHFTRRASMMRDLMMGADDGQLGRIVKAIPDAEVAVLEASWNVQRGWPSKELLGTVYDDDDGWGKWGEKTKEASEFDGERRGGCGRISGRVRFPLKIATPAHEKFEE